MNSKELYDIAIIADRRNYFKIYPQIMFFEIVNLICCRMQELPIHFFPLEVCGFKIDIS